ncbi:mitochondrial carrier [Jaminaea rosea]|uniref:Mitochondrial carrier n=1 Tax=Jaminaea rosea TaxID=1569628 RepID=A0A316UZ94_9BASI|nr:mitochondrial carrier [Jaminaea rosea]PWN30596.1 mitochondrial carrier [Jaminaea rosea]
MSGSPGQGPHPLRPYYQPHDEPHIYSSSSSSRGPSGAASSSASSAAHTTSSSPSATVTIPRRPNRYVNDNDDTLSAAQFGSSISDMTKAGLLGLLLQYSSTCVAMPFEVAKLLLQVQWVPKDEVWNSFVASIAQDLPQPALKRAPGSRLRQQESEEDEEDEEDLDMAPEAQEWRREPRYHDDEDGEDSDLSGDDEDELSSPSDAEAYFRDASSADKPRPASSLSRKEPRRRPAKDASGYLVRRSVRDGAESGSRPEFVMPVVVRGGVWEMMKSVVRGKEGWPGLWKGAFTSFIYDLLASGIQPVVSATLSPLIPMSLSTLPLPYVPHPKRTLALLVSSHVVTHLLLSPLDLVRTRLIVQSTLPRHRKYTGPWDALKKISAEEGGWKSMFLHPNLLAPALLDLTLRPLLSFSSPLLIERWLHLDAMTSPVSHAFAELCVDTASLLFSLPIETVRRRLQIQRRKAEGGANTIKAAAATAPSTPPRGNAKGKSPATATGTGNTGTLKGLRTCVETRPKPYVGVVEAIYRILTEETAYLSTTAGAKEDSKQKDKTHHSRHQRTETEDSAFAPGPGEDPATPQRPGLHPMMGRSVILAPQQPTYATLGGLRSLYRGFTMAAGANLVVFLLTVVTGERVQTTGSGGVGVGGAGGGLWAEI